MKMKIIVARLVMLAAIGTPIAAVPAAAQSATVEIRGTVVDSSGAPMESVDVVVVNAATGAQRHFTTDHRGRFIAPLLPSGPYEVTATQPGFASRRQENLDLQQGRTATLRLELDTAVRSDTIRLAPMPSVLDAAQTHAGGGVTFGEIQRLPVYRRRTVDFARLVPGPAGPFLRTITDGTEADDLLFSLDAVRDLTVVTVAPPLEYEGPALQMTSRSGSNRYQGAAFEFFDDPRSQFGGVLGGPIARDKHFFFGSYDGIRFRQPSSALDTGDAVLIRTDHQFGGDNRLMFRYDDDVRTRFAASSVNVLGRFVVNEVRGQGTKDRGQVADTLAVVAGAHTVKTGVDVLLDDRFASSVDRYALFVQDQWWLNGSTTIEGGVRYGQERSLGRLPDPEATWQPRIGVAWSPALSRFAIRAAYRKVGESLHHSTAGIDWQWVPRVSISFNYLDVRDDVTSFRGATVEIYRRFAQGMHYRASYTFGSNDGVVPGIAAVLPRRRFAASVIYDTSPLAARYSGFAQMLVKDWTISGIYLRDPFQSSLDPRIARQIPLGRAARLTLLWEVFNLGDNERAVTARTQQVAAKVTF